LWRAFREPLLKLGVLWVKKWLRNTALKWTSIWKLGLSGSGERKKNNTEKKDENEKE
jgi:hypothetical protein